MPKDIDDKKQQLENVRTREAAADKAKPRCSVCGKYTDKKTSPQCFGHGGGGSAGAGEDSGSSKEKNDLKNDVAAKKTDMSDDLKTTKSLSKDNNFGVSMRPEPVLTPKEKMFSVIADLLKNKLLTIEDNRGLCTLTIKCDPKLLSEAQRNAVKEFVKAIKKELEDFKSKNGITDKDCFVKTEKDNAGNIISLTINIPNPKLYAEFINHLESKNLLPIQNMAQDKKEMAGATHKQPSPFNAIKEGPKPKGWKG